MVGFVEPNRYQPRAKWRDKLDMWVQHPPGNVGSWQVDITLYWRWTTLQGLSLEEAWEQLRMSVNNAKTSLHPDAADRGLIPPELFSRVLARSRAMGIHPNDNVDPVVLDPEPTPAPAPAGGPIGFTPPNRYRPRAKWRNRLDMWTQFPPGNVGNWQNDIAFYWRWTTQEGMTLEEAWERLRMHPNNAASSLHKDSVDRGLVPPELFSRVLARSQGTEMDPNEIVDPVVLEDEPPA
jgi:hypothetical protein